MVDEESCTLERLRAGDVEGNGSSELLKGVVYGSDKKSDGPKAIFEIDSDSIFLFEMLLLAIFKSLQLFSSLKRKGIR